MDTWLSLVLRIRNAIMVILLIIFTFIRASAAPDWNSVEFGSTGGAQADGKSLADTIKGYNSGGTVQDMLQRPIMGGGDMTTLKASYRCGDKGSIYEDLSVCNNNCATQCGVVSFNAAIECNRNVEAVTIKPYAMFAGGEVALQVNYDTNLDGVLNRTIETPNISGFCVNGIMSCTSGTLNNCNFYEFAVPHKCSKDNIVHANLNDCLNACSAGNCIAQSSYVQLVKSKQEYVGRCDCTNSSCGKSFNSTFDSSMAVFGAGIVNHMVNSLGLSVSKTNLDLSTLSVSYMAMAPGKCGEDEVDINKIKAGKSTGTPDYTSELLAAQKDPDSLYSILTSDISHVEKDCSIVNSVLADGARINVFERQNTCQVANSCNILSEYVCEPVCKLGSLYNPGSYECEIPDEIIHCPSGLSPAYVDPTNGITLTTIISRATMCAKAIGYAFYVNTRRTSTQFPTYSETFNLPDSVSEGSITWRDFNIVASMMRGSHTWDDMVTCFDAMTSKVNSNNLASDKLINGWSYNANVNTEMYRSAPGKVVNGENKVIVDHTFRTCGSNGNKPDHWLNVWLTSEINICPSGWIRNNNGHCVQPAKSIGSLKCTQIIKSGRTTYAQSTYCSEYSSAVVCGDGLQFKAVSNKGSYSTNAGDGRYTTKRTYSCDSQKQKYDYSEVESARKSTYLIENSGEYTLIYKDEHGMTRTANFDGQYDSGGCQKSCRVEPFDSQSSTQVTHNQEKATSSDNYVSRLCIANACPYDPAKEKIIQDCACMQTDDFGKVISILGVLEESTKDKICVK